MSVRADRRGGGFSRVAREERWCKNGSIFAVLSDFRIFRASGGVREGENSGEVCVSLGSL